jgi:hypothetical protein
MFVSVAKDGRAEVLDNGWAASRDASGAWSRGIKFSADVTNEEFVRASAAMALALSMEARTALSEASPKPSPPAKSPVGARLADLFAAGMVKAINKHGGK